jgi:hypothetical protein
MNGKGSMAIKVVHPLLAQSEKRRCIDGIKRVWTQAIEDKQEDHSGATG